MVRTKEEYLQLKKQLEEFKESSIESFEEKLSIKIDTTSNE